MSPSRPMWKRIIGIMGGLGPYAHVEFETLLLEATARVLGRSPEDQDYPPWVLSSMPATPNRTRALVEGKESPVDALVESAHRLSAADFAVIPCNTAHAFLPEVRTRVKIPILDMIQETAERALDRVGPGGGIGVLAASGTVRCGLYQNCIRKIAPRARVVTLLDLPDGEALQEHLVMEPIYRIKSGAFREPAHREALAEPMREASAKLAAAGAELVLTACTEIPLALGRTAVDQIPLLDPMEVAARAAIDVARGERALPS